MKKKSVCNVYKNMILLIYLEISGIFLFLAVFSQTCMGCSILKQKQGVHMHCIFIFWKPLPPALHSKYACSCLHVVSLIKIVHSDSLFRSHQWHLMKQMFYIDILHNHNFPRIGNCNPSSILSKLQLQMRQKLRENILHYYLPIDQIIDHQFCANCLSAVKWKYLFTP